MAQSHADQNLWERENAFLTGERKARPELFVVDPHAGDGLLERCGITAVPQGRSPGYIRFSPLDFLVEEIDPQGAAVSIAAEPKQASGAGGIGTVYADLVKIGISTLDAVQRLADALSVPVDKIRYAGIKDAVAITAQRISMRGVPLATAMALDVPNVLLKRCFEDKGALNVGDLAGNRFTLFIRTPEQLDDGALQGRVMELAMNGVVNFYGLQRFGSPRYIAHLLGLYLLQGNLEEVVRTYVTQASPTENRYVAGLRAQAAGQYGDWAAMRKALAPLPYTFRYEHMLLDVLEKEGTPGGFAKAIAAVPKQADLWARAYASYLANRLLSAAAGGDGRIPTQLPLLLSFDPAARQLYAPYLKVDGTGNFMENLRRFPFINIGKAPAIDVRIRPKFHGVKTVPEGVVISFDLPKAAYATTVLMNLFDIKSGLPLPSWLKGTEYDTKEVLGLGSLGAVREIFGKQIGEMNMSRKAAAGEEREE